MVCVCVYVSRFDSAYELPEILQTGCRNVDESCGEAQGKRRHNTLGYEDGLDMV